MIINRNQVNLLVVDSESEMIEQWMVFPQEIQPIAALLIVGSGRVSPVS